MSKINEETSSSPSLLMETLLAQTQVCDANIVLY